MTAAPLRVRWLGRVPYREALAVQTSLFEHGDGQHLLLLEHPALSHTAEAFQRASGDSLWDIGVSVVSAKDSNGRETWLDIYSGLQGVAIDLPPPLGKPADLEWPVLVRYPIKAAEHVLTATMPGH